MPDLISINQLTASDFTPANRRLPGEASSIGLLICKESKWIQQHWESVATCVDMSTVTVVEVLWKDLQGATKRNLVVASNSLVGRSKLGHLEVCSSGRQWVTADTCLPVSNSLSPKKSCSS